MSDNPFPFHVTWEQTDLTEHEETFEHKNMAIQHSCLMVNTPGCYNVQTTYVDEEGNTYLVSEGCE